MQITSHFSLEEFACHDGTPYPKAWIETRLRPLCEQLELIRYLFGGKPISILSGYRTENHNQKVGGAKNSQHVQGRAADIKIADVPAREVAQKILEAVHNKKLGLHGLGSYSTFTHVDVREADKMAYWFMKT